MTTNDQRRYDTAYLNKRLFYFFLSNSKRSFYRSFNAIFGKVGRLAAEPVTVELLKSTCLPSLYYGLEACPLSSADFKSLEYVVVGAFMKIFNTRPDIQHTVDK